MAVSTLQLYSPYIFSKVDSVLSLSKFLSSLNSFLTTGNVQLPMSVSVCMSSACCRCLSQPQKCCKVPTAGKTKQEQTESTLYCTFFCLCDDWRCRWTWVSNHSKSLFTKCTLMYVFIRLFKSIWRLLTSTCCYFYLYFIPNHFLSLYQQYKEKNVRYTMLSCRETKLAATAPTERAGTTTKGLWATSSRPIGFIVFPLRSISSKIPPTN